MIDPIHGPFAKPARTAYQRNLPHFQADGRPLFITFCTKDRWVLPETVRPAVLEHCLHDHGSKLRMHATVIMPDHVHLLFSPLRDARGDCFGLSEVMSGIKGASAHRVNRLLNRKGSLWQEESFDHVIRCDESLEERATYICNNPVRWGLVARADDYPWLWRQWVEGQKPLRSFYVAQPPRL